MKDIFARCSIFGWHFFLSEFQIYYSTPFWPVIFLLRNLLIFLWKLAYMWQITFLLLPSRFSLCQFYYNVSHFIIICLFGFILLDSSELLEFLYTHFVPLIWEVLAIISSNKLLAPFSFPSGILIVHRLVSLIVSYKSFWLSLLFVVLFFFWVFCLQVQWSFFTAWSSLLLNPF